MFSGIISDIGTITAIEHQRDIRITIITQHSLNKIPIGSSIACNGICLTIRDKQHHQFIVEASPETQSKTTLTKWKIGTHVNLEHSLKLGDPIGGHLIYGHIDGIARVTSMTPSTTENSFEVHLSVPNDVSKFLVPKGAIALDGISLTVNEVIGTTFTVMIIPHTASCTTFGKRNLGDEVNLEVDVLARYVARLISEKQSFTKIS